MCSRAFPSSCIQLHWRSLGNILVTIIQRMLTDPKPLILCCATFYWRVEDLTRRAWLCLHCREYLLRSLSSNIYKFLILECAFIWLFDVLVEESKSFIKSSILLTRSNCELSWVVTSCSRPSLLQAMYVSAMNGLTVTTRGWHRSILVMRRNTSETTDIFVLG